MLLLMKEESYQLLSIFAAAYMGLISKCLLKVDSPDAHASKNNLLSIDLSL